MGPGLAGVDTNTGDDDARELAAAFAHVKDPDSVNYRDFLKFVRDAGGRSERGATKTPRTVDATRAYDGFLPDSDDDLPGRGGPTMSPVRRGRDLFGDDDKDDPLHFSVPDSAWR